MSSGLRPRVDTISPRSRHGVGDGDRLIEQAAAVVAQVDDVALELVGRDFLVDVGDAGLELVEGALALEAGDADVADVAAFDARACVADRDHLADDAKLDGLIGALARDAQANGRVDRSAHLVDGLLEGEPLDLLVVEMGDEVAGLDAGLGRGRAVHGRHHLDHAGLHGDLDAEAAELAARLGLHVAEVLGVEERRVRVERGQHAVDRRLDKFRVVGLLDVLGTDVLEDVAEQIELAIGVGTRRRLRRGADEDPGLDCRHGEYRACGSAEQKQSCLSHHPRAFSSSDVAHQGLGSIEFPSLRNSI